MTPRAFLVRGLVVGLLAGIATFLVAYTVGEPQVETAISLEESAAAPADEAAGHSHDEGEEAGHSHSDEEGTTVSRSNQRTFGLVTGTLAVGVALGGILALVSAAAAGRLGRMSLAQSTAVVSLVGFVSVALVPFLKYPATPPAVGDGATIGMRTGVYFVFLALSVIAAVAAVIAANQLWTRTGAFGAVVGAAAAYVVVMVVVGSLMPTVNEVGEFPADTLWYFRRASITTLTALWAALGIGLAWTLGRLQQQTQAGADRRQLAASL